MHYDFLLKLDKVASNQNKNFNTAEIDWFLNEAQEMFKKQRLFSNNIKQLGFENSQKRIDDLSTLHIKFPDQAAVTVTAHNTFSGVYLYELPLQSLEYAYEYFVKGFAYLQNSTCTTKAKMYVIQNDDFDEAISSPYELTEERILINFGKSSSQEGTSSIYIYSLYPIKDNLVYIEYIKKHRDVNYGNYVYIDNVTKPETHSEFPPHTHREIVDIAVLNACGVIQSANYNIFSQKLTTNE